MIIEKREVVILSEEEYNDIQKVMRLCNSIREETSDPDLKEEMNKLMDLLVDLWNLAE